jgi:hypothetical protein
LAAKLRIPLSFRMMSRHIHAPIHRALSGASPQLEWDGSTALPISHHEL